MVKGSGNNLLHKSASVWLAILIFISNSSSLAQTAAEQPFGRCWDRAGAVSLRAGIVSDATSVFVAEDEGRVVALDRGSGTVSWKAELGGKIDTPLIVAGSVLYVVSRVPGGTRSGGAYVRAISRATGITNWTTELPPAEHYFVKSANGTLVLQSDKMLIGMDGTSGAVKWKKEIVSTGVTEPSVSGNGLIVRVGSKKFEKLSVETGKAIETIESPKSDPSLILGHDGDVIFADVRGNLISRPSGGWKYKAGGALTHITGAGKKLLAASADNFIYSLSFDSGNVEWKRRMPGRISSLTVLGENTAVVGVVGERTVYIVDLDDGRFVDQMQLVDGEELPAVPAAGDERFVVVITSSGVAAFGPECGKGKGGE